MVLQSFLGFGENWYALEECWGNLDEWLPAHAYVFFVERAEELLKEESLGETISSLKVIHATGEFWAKPIADGDRSDRSAVPFHVLRNLANTVAGMDSDIARAVRARASLSGTEAEGESYEFRNAFAGQIGA